MKRIFALTSALMLTTALVPADAEAARRPTAVVVVHKTPARVWVPTHTTWSVSLGRNVTVVGQWRVPPRANVSWVSGRWAGHGRNKHWVAGHWAPRR